MGNSKRVVFVIVACLSLATVAWWLLFNNGSFSERTGASVEEAQRLFHEQQYELALRAAESVLAQRDDPAALMVAGESATKLGRFDQAIALYRRVPDSDPRAAVARWAIGEIEFHLGHASRAIAAMEQSLALNYDNPDAHERIIWLYNACGRRWDSLPHLVYMLQTNHFRIDYLLLIGNLAKPFESPSHVERFLQSDPEDPLPYLALGRAALERGDFEQAELHLRRVVRDLPQLAEGHAQLGLLYLRAFPERLPRWSAFLPAAALTHPDVWYVRGQWLSSQDPRRAVGCLAEAVRIDPNHLRAHQLLAQLFHQLNQRQLSAAASQRVKLLQQLNITLEQIYSARQYPPLLNDAAEYTLQLGRVWEMRGWCAYAASVDRSLTWPAEMIRRAEKMIPPNETIPHTLLTHQLHAHEDWPSQFPVPDDAFWQAQLDDSRRLPEAHDGQLTLPMFVDITDSCGFSFQYVNNSRHRLDGRRIIETTGGGIGILDFERDGYPDLFFVQGGSIDASGPAADNPSDQLYRHVGSSPPSWSAVTNPARIQEHAFGQGIAIGDVDNDGFDDIYVANIGINALWLNAGDGTFLSATHLFPPHDVWTCSAAMVDFDGDGINEIYDANYVRGDDIFTRLCPAGDQMRSCSPLVFAPEPDTLWQATGEAFNPVPIPTMVGNSLGVVAFRTPPSPHPHAFVSVDQQANLWGTFRSLTSGQWTLEDEAIVSGLAYDADGNAQACMGIAAGDVDDDGDVDLYVTNFYLEYNTLYVQQPHGFIDATAAAGAIAATRPMLGFGTQFLDAQLDGKLDIVVLNGHVDDHTHRQVPQAMPAQLFLGLGAGRFVDTAGKEVGSFFDNPRIGRALALLDANRDGDWDLIAADLEQHAAIIDNASRHVGQPLQIELIGTKASRNAFTSVVTLQSGDFRQSQQLIAGSGYQAANERLLSFAVPPSVHEVSLTVQWPHGGTQPCKSLKPGWRYAIVEGQTHAIAMHQLTSASPEVVEQR
ncbi:MAG: RNA-binding protein [Pirellulaceae bacterium]|nr:MAG: RNA-binding protein [Pirellulaceae bacterium]